MDLPEIGVATSFFPAAVCAVCDQPCCHEDPATGIPWPGAYVAATINNPEALAAPVCDPCVERHYPQMVKPLEAERLHYWTH